MAERTSRLPRRKEEKILSSVQDPAVRELLDHIAEELAEEYVRLMNEAASKDKGEVDG